jgi:hypothetical protein
MERDVAVLVAAGGRLAHVVQQGSEPDAQPGTGLGHYGDGVAQHILVPVDGVLLEPQSRKLGENLIRAATVDQLPETTRRVALEENCGELLSGGGNNVGLGHEGSMVLA